MLTVKQDKNRDEQKEGQIFVKLSKYRNIMNIHDCDCLGYWCDKAHLSHFIMECAKCFTENELKDILKMDKEIINIKKENVMVAYNEARRNGYIPVVNALEALFGKETFQPKDITERVKTFEDACHELGENHPLVIQYKEIYDCFLVGAVSGNSCDIIAYLKLRIICTALNEGWEPQFTGDERRYYPWFWLYTLQEIENMKGQEKQDRHLIPIDDYKTGPAYFSYASACHDNANTTAVVGSRLYLKNIELAEYCGNQFIDLWADFNLIRK